MGRISRSVLGRAILADRESDRFEEVYDRGHFLIVRQTS